MDEDKAEEATTAGETTEVRRWGSEEPIRVLSPGQEIDARPDPAGVHISDETQLLKKPERRFEEAPEEGWNEVDWPEGHTTGAFVSRAASLRHEVKPYRWWDRISPAMLVLWGGFVGVPAGAGVWAVYEVWRRVHGG
jgi:hypothetical protein